MKIKCLLLAALIFAFGSLVFAQKSANTTAPDAVIRNLYAAHKANPKAFFQTKSRATLDKYFTKSLADLIWKELKGSKGEVGNLDFDPFYNAQDTKITAFKIGKPEYGEGNARFADVPVTFKNFGKTETVLFKLEQSSNKTWKISNVFYPKDNSSLKAILAQ